MNRNVIETVLGGVVLLTAAVFLAFAYGSADLGKKAGYNVRADFDRIDGLKAGGDVRMNGVMVGSILNIALDKQTFRATVNFSVDDKIKLPRDTVAMIASESLLGGKYLSLEVGVEDENIATDGTGKLTRTTPPMRLDDLVGHMIFKEDDKKKQQQQPQQGAGGSTSVEPNSAVPLLAMEPEKAKSELRPPALNTQGTQSQLEQQPVASPTPPSSQAAVQ